ncbi:MAG: hypothetical protein QM692_16500 [Thermomicrobiales bacterium]
MSEKDAGWDDLVDRLRGAVSDLRSAAGRPAPDNADEAAAAAHLKANLSRLEETASRLRASLTTSLDAQKAGFETGDRDKAEATASQLKDSLQELLGMAKNVASDVKTGAQATYAQSEPELKSAIRTLEDVASSTGAWVKTVIDPNKSSRPE